VTATTPERALDLVVDSLAVKRLTRLVTEDTITEPLRVAFYRRFGGPETSKIAYLLSCPHCVSIWLAAGVQVARIVMPGVWSVAARGLALSAVTSLIAERE
jgi:hypothetical protein